MVLSPGGLATIAVMPLVGALISRVQARWLIAFGFAITALAMFHMVNINPHIDYWTAMNYRIYQSIGLAFLFVPITTIAYAGIPQSKNNQVSSIVNLGRNVGGSVGIAMVTTILARRSQTHQHQLIFHLSGYDRALQDAIAGMTSMFVDRGYSPADAAQQSYGQLYRLLQFHSAALAYVDAVWLMAIAACCMIPLVLLMKKNDPRAASMAAH
jgi:DHA2 family multidrug resistance protein